MLHHVSQKFPQCCLWNSSNIGLADDGLFSSFHRRSSSTSYFYAFFYFDGVMSFVLCPQVVVSSSSTLQIFWSASHLQWLLCLPAYLVSHFSHHWHVQDDTSTESGKASGFPTLIFTSCWKLIEIVKIMACMVCLSPLAAIQQKACLTASISIAWDLHTVRIPAVHLMKL